MSADSQGEASGKADQASKGSRHKRKFSQSRFDESASTVVTRVPNKSVEDLYCLDCGPKTKAGTGHSSSTSSHSELSPGVERHQAELSPGLDRPSTSSDCGVFSSASVSPDGAGCLWLEDQQSSELPSTEWTPGEHSMFGTIKDLSVSNIHATDKDKTSEFLSKDFHALFQTGKLHTSPSKSSGPSSTADRPLVRASASSGRGEDSGALLSRPAVFPPSSSSSSSPPASSVSVSEVELELSLPAPAATAVLDSPDCAFLPSPPSHDPVPSWQQPAALLEKVYNTSAGRQASSAKARGRTPVALQDRGRMGSAYSSEGSSQGSGSRCSSGYVGMAGRSHDDEHVSLLEMAENLLQMTAEMHSHIHSSSPGVDNPRAEDEESSGAAGHTGEADTLPSPFSDLMTEASTSLSPDSGEDENKESSLRPPPTATALNEERAPTPPTAATACDREAGESDEGVEEDILVSVVGTAEQDGPQSPAAAAAKERPSFFV